MPSIWQKLAAQINTFDNGKTFKNPNPVRTDRQGAQDDAQIRVLQQLARTNPVQARAVVAQIRAVGTNHPVEAARVLTPTNFVSRTGQKVIDTATNKVVAPVQLGIARSGQGTLEGASGLYDLFTPGKGNNRLTKTLQKQNTALDKVVKDRNYNRLAYHGTQAVTDAATFYAMGKIPGINQVGETAGKLPGASQVGAALDNVIENGGRGSRYAAQAARFLGNPETINNVLSNTLTSAGQRSAKGGKVTPLSVVEDVGMNIATAGVLHLAGKGASKVADPIEERLKAIHILRPANITDNEAAVLAKFHDLARSGSLTMDDETYHQARAIAQKAGIDYRDPKQVQDLLHSMQTYSMKKTQATQFLREHASLGMSAQAVDQNGKPIGALNAMREAKAARNTQATPSLVENRLTTGGKSGRQNLSGDTQALISGEHNVRNTAELGQRGEAAVGKLNLDDAVNQAHERLAVPQGKINDEDVSFIGKAIERADAEGRPQDASALHDSLSEHLVAQGQSVQAASLLYQRSPQGIYYQAERDLKRAGVKVDPEVKAKLQGLTDAIKGAKNPTEKINAIAKFHQAVSKIMPQKASDQLTSIWKAGLLSGTKTQTGNALSNGTFAAFRGVTNPVSTAFDKGISLFTGERTKTNTLKGLGSGLVEGTKKGVGTLKTGIDARNFNGGKYEQHAEINFKNPVVQKVFGVGPNLVFRGMNAADQPWYYSALKNTLNDAAKADGLNKGLHGADLQAHMKAMVENPTTKIAQIAKDAADKATLGYDTIASKAVQGIHGSIDRFQGKNAEVSKAVAHGTVNVLAPFVRVPTAYLARSLDYSPAGYVKAVTKTISSLKAGEGVPQRELSEALGEATTGTAAIFMGAALAAKGLVSGQQPKDPREAARWKAEHITPNSVKVGNNWVSLNYLGPAGILFGAGKDYQDASVTGDNATLASISGAGKNLTGQSFLTGFSGFSNAIQDPQRSAKSFLNSEVSSVVPSIVNDAANASDAKQRETNNPIQAAQAKIPIARNSLPAKQDVYGNELTQRTDPFNLTTNPLRPSEAAQNNPVLSEVSRLHSVDPNNTDLQVTPTPLNGAINIEGRSVKVNDTQKHNLQKQIGQMTQANWGRLIPTPQYQALNDIEKAAALTKLRQASTELAQRSYVVEHNLGEYTKPASKLAAALGANNVDLSMIIKGNTPTKTSAHAKKPTSAKKSSGVLAKSTLKLPSVSFSKPRSFTIKGVRGAKSAKRKSYNVPVSTKAAKKVKVKI